MVASLPRLLVGDKCAKRWAENGRSTALQFVSLGLPPAPILTSLLEEVKQNYRQRYCDYYRYDDSDDNPGPDPDQLVQTVFDPMKQFRVSGVALMSDYEPLEGE